MNIVTSLQTIKGKDKSEIYLFPSVQLFIVDTEMYPDAEQIYFLQQKIQDLSTNTFALTAVGEYLGRKSAEQGLARRARVISRLQARRVLTVEALKELVTLYEKSGELYDRYSFTLEFA